MDAIRRRLFGSEVLPHEGAPAHLGPSAREAALDDPEAVPELEPARLFDLAFVDAMVAHHRGAIAHAEASLRVGADPDLRLLAEATIAGRGQEMRETGDFRVARYGQSSSRSDVSTGTTRGVTRTTGSEP